AAAASATSLRHRDREGSGLGDRKVPAHPIFGFGPITDRVLMRLGLVTDRGAMHRDLPGQQLDRAILGLKDRLFFVGDSRQRRESQNESGAAENDVKLLHG